MTIYVDYVGYGSSHMHAAFWLLAYMALLGSSVGFGLTDEWNVAVTTADISQLNGHWAKNEVS